MVVSVEPTEGANREVKSRINMIGRTIMYGLTLAVEDNHCNGAKCLKSSSILVVIVSRIYIASLCLIYKIIQVK